MEARRSSLTMGTIGSLGIMRGMNAGHRRKMLQAPVAGETRSYY